MDSAHIKNILEALLYMTDHPLSEKEIIAVLDQKISDDEIRTIIQEIRSGYEEMGSSLRIVQVAGGYQVATRPEMGMYIRRLYKERLTVRLSPSALETLSIIAYKQPIARSEIEQIRGVEVSGVMETLLERRLIKVVGRKETIGRPLLYGTSVEFLRHFGLRHLAELPDLNSFATADMSLPATDGASQPQAAEVAAGEEPVPELVPAGEDGSQLPLLDEAKPSES